MHSQHYNNDCNNNNMMEQTKHLNPLVEDNNNNTRNGGMSTTIDKNGNNLRAASFVSMDGTLDPHEYQPTCHCADCRDILLNHTNHDILDHYLAEHLRYEAKLKSDFSFVPCYGGPKGNVATKTIVDERTGQENTITHVGNTYLFHMHLHTMPAISPETRERSYQRYFDKTAVTIPTPNSRRNNNNNTMMNNNNKQFATHQNVHYQGRVKNFYNNRGSAPAYNENYNGNYFNNNNNNVAAPDYNAATYNNNNYYYNTAPCTGTSTYNYNNYKYTENDVEKAQQSVAFSGVARLGM